jgi:sterol carrier protein 2
MSGRKVCVIGVGMTPFSKPGASPEYNEMARDAGKAAIKDAGIEFSEIEQAAVGYVYGDSTCGQRAVYELGLTGIPVYNVNNNCSTGSTALFLAKQLVEGGLAECVLALGFEKMEKGALGSKFTDRLNPMDKHVEVMLNKQGYEPMAPPAAQMFGGGGREHMEKYGTTHEQFAKIAVKNRKHAVENPFSVFRQAMSLEEIMSAPMVFDPLTRFQCCPPTCGAGAAIVCSEEFAKKHGHTNPVYIAGMAMVTDFPSSFETSMIKMIGSDMTKAAAKSVYEQAGIGPEDVDVIELHDCFTANELITYEGLGLCEDGFGGKLIDDQDVTYGGKWVVNPSGGLLSKGHPLGATGLAQCAELNWQLRGEAEKRQVEGAKVGLQHNLGLGGAAVVTMYRRD